MTETREIITQFLGFYSPCQPKGGIPALQRLLRECLRSRASRGPVAILRGHRQIRETGDGRGALAAGQAGLRQLHNERTHISVASVFQRVGRLRPKLFEELQSFSRDGAALQPLRTLSRGDLRRLEGRHLPQVHRERQVRSLLSVEKSRTQHPTDDERLQVRPRLL